MTNSNASDLGPLLPGSEPSQIRSPRRTFLEQLTAVTFLTPGVIKAGLLPTSVFQHGQPVDQSCRVKAKDGSFSADYDCGEKTDDGVDQDCGLLAGAESGAKHKDHDCEPNESDSDCGTPTGNGFEKHQDQACTSGHTDNDCGTSNDYSGSAGHSDNDCSSSSQTDSDCGIYSNASAGHEDNDCATQVAGGGYAADNSCGVQAAEGPHSDEDCGLLGTDNDCQIVASNGDMNCTQNDDPGDNTDPTQNPKGPSDGP